MKFFIMFVHFSLIYKLIAFRALTDIAQTVSFMELDFAFREHVFAIFALLFRFIIDCCHFFAGRDLFYFS